MPVISSSYCSPLLLRSGHLQTIFGAYKTAPEISYRRQRVETADGDFLDIDQAGETGQRLAIISYGMEGDSHRRYVRTMVQAIVEVGHDAWVWNYRGISGEPNRKVHFYHGGLVDDLARVIHEARLAGYRHIDLIGFSLGGNLTMNYLGRLRHQVPGEIHMAACVSVPCDVEDCARRLHAPDNKLYIRRFLNSFRERIRQKMHVMPGHIDDVGFDEIKTLEEYDARYTVPHFGFADVPAFYKWVSSKYVLGGIHRPTLLVNALDDPFLGRDCFPFAEAERNPFLTLEIADHGGHLGFLGCRQNGLGWIEQRVLAYLGLRLTSSLKPR